MSGAIDHAAFLRKSFDVARRARQNGNHPFGAILVGPQGELLIECENGFMPDHDMTAHAERHALMPYLAVAFSLQGEMLIKRGEVETGMNLLRRSLSTLRADRYGLYTTELNSALAGGFAMTGRLDQALVTVDETIALVERNGDLLMPELLRIRGEILEQAADERRAEEAFLRSIALRSAAMNIRTVRRR